MKPYALCTLILVLFSLVLTTCVAPLPAGNTSQSAQLPLTGAFSSKLGPAALAVQDHSVTHTYTLVPVSAATGKPVPSAGPVTLGSQLAYSFSKDRSRMAFLTNHPSNARSSACT